MKFFNKTKQRQLHFIVIGCGHFGFPIVRFLTEQDFNVTCIDLEAKTFADVPLSFHECMIEGDGTDPETLEAAGIESADIVIAATNNDAVNIVISQMAREKYHVGKVVARLYNADHEDAYLNLGIHVINPVMLFTDECCRFYIWRGGII
jgi:trk system potassium uptake protein TrkA